ncbi:uncharacterized protein MELLADRAFT_58677 [Melampsora larici-populina 98AG31]|uniref:Uncharacterized protein n=1 Tax=Melampsora larici-populina (strain 98AG31 / pathotype 3-4-7) TaxID=747676 RepID=F4R4F9_MELLP|nr:uncharacterized protein MELLADRAFT_58677 [Melampsora larici-populina 98AG31]EGG13008.1 hypothetical protein MELLADRAFT_58677 [Melampsora larici-populina 98AG31]
MLGSLTHFNQTDSASHPATGASKSTGNTQPNPSHLSKAVRKDPAVFPLAFIIGSVILVAGYFVTQKAPKEGGGVESYGPNRPPTSPSRPVKSATGLSSNVPYNFSGLFKISNSHEIQSQPFSKFFLRKN